MEELEKLREETAGINALFENKTLGNSAGLVSNSILLEIRDILRKMAEKQEKFEEKIEKIEENQRKSEEKTKEVCENQKKMIEKVEKIENSVEIKEQLVNIHNEVKQNYKTRDSMKVEEKFKQLSEEGLNALKTMMEENTSELSKKVEKLEEELKNANEELDKQRIKIYIFHRGNYSRRITMKVQKRDKIKILEPGVFKKCGFHPSKYYNWDEKFNLESTFREHNLKDGSIIFCE